MANITDVLLWKSYTPPLNNLLGVISVNIDPLLRRNHRNLRPRALALLSSSALFLAGCVNANKPQTVTRTVGEQPTSAAQGSSNGSGQPVKFMFDSLGSQLSKGGSSIIRVYRGVKNVPVDKGNEGTTGTYASGQTAEADCKIEGRSVSSVPSEGEVPRTSHEWLHISSAESSTPMYATEVYTDPAETSHLSNLPNCQSAP